MGKIINEISNDTDDSYLNTKYKTILSSLSSLLSSQLDDLIYSGAIVGRLNAIKLSLQIQTAEKAMNVDACYSYKDNLDSKTNIDENKPPKTNSDYVNSSINSRGEYNTMHTVGYYNFLNKATCLIVNSQFNIPGTGWLCSSDGLIMTAGHLFARNENSILTIEKVDNIKVPVLFNNGDEFIAEVEYCHYDPTVFCDFAILSINLHTEKPYLPIDFSLKSYELLTPSDVHICGYDSRFPKIHPGTLQAPNNDIDSVKINCENAARKGFSGAPIFHDATECIIALQTEATSIKLQAIGENEIIGMPIERIISELSEVGKVNSYLLNILSRIPKKKANPQINPFGFNSRTPRQILECNDIIIPLILTKANSFEPINAYDFCNAILLNEISENPVIIQGEGGAGKTTLLAKVYNIHCETYNFVFIPASKLTYNTIEQVTSPIAKYINNYYFYGSCNDDNEVFQKLSQIKNLICFIDGYNEVLIPSDGYAVYQDYFNRDIERIEIAVEGKLVITTRIIDERLINGRSVYQINPLDRQTIENELHNKTKNLNTNYSQFEIEDLLSVLTTPLLLNLFIETVDYNVEKIFGVYITGIPQKPTTPGEIILKYLDYCIKKNAKAGNSDDSINVAKTTVVLLTLLPYIVYECGVFNLSISNIKDKTNKFSFLFDTLYLDSGAFNYLNELDIAINTNMSTTEGIHSFIGVAKIIQELLVKHNILVNDGDNYVFTHPLLGETLSTLHISNQMKISYNLKGICNPYTIDYPLTKTFLENVQLSLLSDVLQEHKFFEAKHKSILRKYLTLFEGKHTDEAKTAVLNCCRILTFSKRKFADIRNRGLSCEKFTNLDFSLCSGMGYDVFGTTFEKCTFKNGFFSQITSFYEISAVKFIVINVDNCENQYVAILTQPGAFIIFDSFTYEIKYKERLISSESLHQGVNGFDFADLTVVYDHKSELIFVSINKYLILVFNNELKRITKCSISDLKEHIRIEFSVIFNNQRLYRGQYNWEQILGDEVSLVYSEMSQPRHCIKTKEHLILSDYSSSTILVWNLSSECKPIGFLRIDTNNFLDNNLNTRINGIDLSSDGKLLVSVHDNGNVCFWDVKRGRLINQIIENANISCATIIDNNKVAVGLDSGWVKIWDINRGIAINEKQLHSREITCIRFRHTNGLLVTGSKDGSINNWTFPFSEECSNTLNKSSYSNEFKQKVINNLNEKDIYDSVRDISIDDESISSIGWRDWYFWGEKKTVETVPLKAYSKLDAFSHDGSIVIYSEEINDSDDQITDCYYLCSYNLHNKEKSLLCTIRWKFDFAEFSPDDSKLAICIGNELYVYDFLKQNIQKIEYTPLKLHDDQFDNPADQEMYHINDTARFTLNGQTLVYCNYEGVIRLFDVNNNYEHIDNKVYILPCVLYANITPDGNSLVAINSDVIAVYNLSNSSLRLSVNLNSCLRNNYFYGLESTDISKAMLDALRQNGNHIDDVCYENVATVTEASADIDIGYDRTFIITRVLDFFETVARYTLCNELPILEVKRINNFIKPQLETNYAYNSSLIAIYTEILYALKKSGESYDVIMDLLFAIAFRFPSIAYGNSNDICLNTIVRNLSSWSRDIGGTLEECDMLIDMARRIVDEFKNRLSDSDEEIIAGSIFAIIKYGQKEVYHILNDDENNIEIYHETLLKWKNVYYKSLSIIRGFYQKGNDHSLVISSYTNTLNELMRLVKDKQQKLDIIDELYFVYRDNKLLKGMAYNFARSCDHFAYESVDNQNYSDIKLVLTYLEEVNEDFPDLPDILFVLVVYNIALVGQKNLAFFQSHKLPLQFDTLEDIQHTISNTLNGNVEFAYSSKLFDNLVETRHNPISDMSDENRWTKVLQRILALLIQYGYFWNVN